jgi:hypothetical protein
MIIDFRKISNFRKTRDCLMYDFCGIYNKMAAA